MQASYATPGGMASGKRHLLLGLPALISGACAHSPPPAHAPAPASAAVELNAAASTPPPAPPAPSAQALAELRAERALAAAQAQVSKTARAGDLPELFVVEAGPFEPWIAMVANRTDRTYRVQNDPALLSFRVQVPGRKEALICAPPKAQIPNVASASGSVELAPGEALFHRFEPRSLCFRENNEDVLVPGALVRGHFGWPTLKKTRWVNGKREEYAPAQKAPFAAQVSEPLSPENLKELVSPELALSEQYEETPAVVAAVPLQALELSLQRGSDVRAATDVVVEIGLKNRSTEPQRLFFRREHLSFEVLGPSGKMRCEPSPDDRAPDAKAFQTLKPGQLMTVASRMIELCPQGAFSRPGLYQVSATLRAKESGRALGLEGFTGELKAPKMALVRRLPSKAMAPQRMSKILLQSGNPLQSETLLPE